MCVILYIATFHMCKINILIKHARCWVLQVSPADGRVLQVGPVFGSRVQQVKGVTYSLDTFLGKNKSFVTARRRRIIGACLCRGAKLD